MENFDAFSETLRSLRISGSVLLNEEYAPPWAVAIPEAAKLNALLQLEKHVRVADFHIVRRGHIEIIESNGHRIVVESGEMAICFDGLSHVISQGGEQNALPFECLMAGGSDVFKASQTERARSVALICGLFLMRDVTLNPLLAALPPVLHLSSAHLAANAHLPGLLTQIAREIDRNDFGSQYIIERLIEVLCVEALRAHLETIPLSGHGWFSGLKDPVVGRAIALIHAKPGEPWTVERLAERVSMSSSRFAARFSAALGDSPIAYLTKWRMNVASRIIANSQQRIETVAVEVGYENTAAFCRAFKKHLGVSPVVWRSGMQAA